MIKLSSGDISSRTRLKASFHHIARRALYKCTLGQPCSRKEAGRNGQQRERKSAIRQLAVHVLTLADTPRPRTRGRVDHK